MKLKSFGCSFIFGTDLGDCRYDKTQLYPKPSAMTWPALIAKHLGMDYECRAHGGSGNLAIYDRWLNDISVQEECCFYVIGWTYIDRFDYRDADGGPTGTNDWETVRPSNDDVLSDIYYKRLQSDYRDKLTSLCLIDHALEILKGSGHKFIMTMMDDLAMDQTFHTSPGIINLQKRILPYMTNFEGLNFLDWSKQKKFPISSSNHPLELAHRAAAEYIIDAIQHRA